MHCRESADDLIFRDSFEACKVPMSEFSHRAHLRLAFVYLCEDDADAARVRMRRALLHYLDHHGAPRDRFHETLTLAWLQAVDHFMHRAGSADGFDALLAADDRLLDTGIMFSHYRRDTLFSDAARKAMLPPDRQPIPIRR